MAEMQHDKGPWAAGKDGPGKVFVESDDVTHDVRLYVNGDFANDRDRMRYARLIADRLNAPLPGASIGMHGPAVVGSR